MNENIVTRDRLIMALDMPDSYAAKVIIRKLDDSVNFFKVGMELFADPGVIEVIALLKRLNKKIFVDLKYFDIPETVHRATRRLVDQGIDFMTVHATLQTVNAAVIAAQGSPTNILAVTVLTSMSQYDLEQMGILNTSVSSLVLSRASMAMKQGADGVVCSGLEAKLLRDEYGDNVGYIVTPGIRASNSAADDQKRTVTVEEAFSNGADYIVVGRPIRDAANPVLAAEHIQSQILQIFGNIK